MSKSWGAIGAWAADVEREESEMASRPPVPAPLAAAEPQSFPSLKEAVAAKHTKKKKQVMTLGEFQSGAGSRREPTLESRGLTHEEMRMLPSGPRDRSADDDHGRLGGGFRSYGGGRRMEGGGWGRERGDDMDGSGRAGGRTYGGFSDDRRPHSSMASDFDERSRADEAENWSTMKKPMGLPPDSRRGLDSYSSLGGTGNSSKADDVDNWNAGKKAFPVRSGGSFGSDLRAVQADLGRRKLVLDPPRKESVSIEPQRTRPSPFGTARPREEVLAEKGLDWKSMDSEVDRRKNSRPSSAQSSRPESPGAQPELVPKPKINPFGDAKPRELLLEEKGKDWRKIDFELEHRAVDRPETMEERLLRDEIHQLKQKLSRESQRKPNDEPDQETAELPSLEDLVARKERDLELLVQELDDKVRFGQRGSERPGSGRSRTGSGYLERPPSQSSLSEDSRSIEFGERPRSRGAPPAPDVWTRTDDRRGFRERGFLGNRDTDRFRSKERW